MITNTNLILFLPWQETQTELVLKVYLRLVEDAVLLQTIPHQRRREIMLGLTANMKDLFEMFVQFLRLHTNLADENVRIRIL